MEWYKLPRSHWLLFRQNKALYHSCASALAAHLLGGPPWTTGLTVIHPDFHGLVLRKYTTRITCRTGLLVEWKLTWRQFSCLPKLALNKVIMTHLVRRQTKPSTISFTCAWTACFLWDPDGHLKGWQQCFLEHTRWETLVSIKCIRWNEK